MRDYIPPVNDDERLFVKRIRELINIVNNSGLPRATMFLSDRQQSMALSVLLHDGISDYVFWGGYVGSERAILCVGDTQVSAKSRVEALNIKTFKENSLTHRDYLGALLSLGIKRECLGDILTDQNTCTVFLLPKTAEIVSKELVTVGKENVTIVKDCKNEYIKNQVQTESLSTTVASMRLDSVLSAMLKCSRSAAQTLIKSKKIEVNHIPIESVHYEVQSDDVFTISGIGKYKLNETGGKSRKDRLFIKYYKY